MRPCVSYTCTGSRDMASPCSASTLRKTPGQLYGKSWPTITKTLAKCMEGRQTLNPKPTLAVSLVRTSCTVRSCRMDFSCSHAYR